MPLQNSSKRADHVSGLHFPLTGGTTNRAAGSCADFDQAAQLNLADTALRLARKSGAGYVDLRIGCNEEEVTHARERRLERFNSTISAGFGIRVLLHAAGALLHHKRSKRRKSNASSVSRSKLPKRTA